jgi:hypothetical protein
MVTIKHNEASLRRSATNRFFRAKEDLQRHARNRKVRRLVAGLIIVLVATAGILGVRLLF